jgi:hypothetical protein
MRPNKFGLPYKEQIFKDFLYSWDRASLDMKIIYTTNEMQLGNILYY